MDFILRSDGRARVLMVTFISVVTDDCFLAALAAVRDFVAQHGPHHGIIDFSQAGSIEMSNELLDELGRMAPAFPITMRRLVIAPTPSAHVAASIVQMLRKGSFAEIEIIKTLDEAYRMLKTSDSDFT